MNFYLGDLWTDDPYKNVEGYSEGKRHYPGEEMLSSWTELITQNRI